MTKTVQAKKIQQTVCKRSARVSSSIHTGKNSSKNSKWQLHSLI